MFEGLFTENDVGDEAIRIGNHSFAVVLELDAARGE